MNRTGLVSIAGVLLGVSVLGAPCGGDGLSDSPLPPMYTTTTSTTSLTTTTEAVLQQYMVQAGDQLGNIAHSFGVDMQALMDLNGIVNQDKIQVGQVLKIPPATVPVAVTLPPP